MSYRYLDEFTAMLTNADPERTRDRLLLGISRLVGRLRLHRRRAWP